MKPILPIVLLGCGIAAAAADFTVESVWQGDLFVAKHRIYRLEHYKIAAAEPAEGIWRLGETETGRGPEITLARPVESAPPQVRAAALPEAEWVGAPVPSPDGGRRPVNCDVSLRWFTPELIYDDEIRDFDWELATALPTAAEYRVDIVPDRDNVPFPAQQLHFNLAGRAADDRFGPGEYRKTRVPLAGRDLTEPLTVAWVVSIPGLELCRKTLCFLPVEALPPLTVGEDGLWYDEAGARVVPVLHRKALAEQRTLELAKNVSRSALTKRRVMVLCEDFGPDSDRKLGRELRDALTRDGYELFFVPWFAASDTGTDWGATIPRVLRAIAAEPADQILIVPPGGGHRPQLRSDEEWVRLTDLLLHAAWAQPDVKRVILATPLSDPTAPDDARYAAGLRQLLRDADTELFELAGRFEAQPGWRDAYRPTPDNTAETSSHPLLSTRLIARLLADAVAGR